MTPANDLDRLLADLGKILRSVDAEDRRAFVRALHEARTVFVAGAGRSGLVVRAFAMRLAHLGLRVHVVGESTAPYSWVAKMHTRGSVSQSRGDFGCLPRLQTHWPESHAPETKQFTMLIFALVSLAGR